MGHNQTCFHCMTFLGGGGNITHFTEGKKGICIQAFVHKENALQTNSS